MVVQLAGRFAVVMCKAMRETRHDDASAMGGGVPGLPRHCTLCPRRCGANRRAGEVGACGADDRLVVARAALHRWEEPPISVGAGSGAVFFAHCPLRCIYCQNAPIAWGAQGTPIAPGRLARIFFELAAQGAANINLVTPTHYLPFVLSSIARAREQGLALPFICNTSGYETVKSVRAMHGSIDVYLTDFKYWRDDESDAARRYSQAPDYFEVADAALRAMLNSVGSPRFDRRPQGGEPADAGCAERDREDSSGVFGHGAGSASGPAPGEEQPQPRLARGVVVRHLMLPGRLDDSKRILARLWAEYGDDLVYSIMSQYTPLRAFPEAPELDVRVPDDEYERLLDYLDSLGMPDYFWQEGGAARESFIPAFDGTGVTGVSRVLRAASHAGG